MALRGRGRSSFSRGFRGGPRRQTRWLASPDISAVTVLTGGAATFFGQLNAEELALRPFTVVRTVGMFAGRSDQIAASEDAMGAFGMAVVSEAAIAIGVTALPAPISDEESDLWFAYDTIAPSLLFNDATGFQSPAMQYRYFDSRAMRKVEDGSDIAVMLEAGSGVGMSIYLKFRILVKLH